MADRHIAPMNAADAVATPGAPRRAGFMAAPDETPAGVSSGFVRHLLSDSGNGPTPRAVTFLRRVPARGAQVDAAD